MIYKMQYIIILIGLVKNGLSVKEKIVVSILKFQKRLGKILYTARSVLGKWNSISIKNIIKKDKTGKKTTLIKKINSPLTLYFQWVWGFVL